MTMRMAATCSIMRLLAGLLDHSFAYRFRDSGAQEFNILIGSDKL